MCSPITAGLKLVKLVIIKVCACLFSNTVYRGHLTVFFVLLEFIIRDSDTNTVYSGDSQKRTVHVRDPKIL